MGQNVQGRNDSFQIRINVILVGTGRAGMSFRSKHVGYACLMPLTHVHASVKRVKNAPLTRAEPVTCHVTCITWSRTRVTTAGYARRPLPMSRFWPSNVFDPSVTHDDEPMYCHRLRVRCRVTRVSMLVTRPIPCYVRTDSGYASDATSCAYRDRLHV